MSTVCIICGGGPAPGINTVIASVTKTFVGDGYRVIGVHDGYKGLFGNEPCIEELTYRKAESFFSRGGSVLKMSRFKPKDEDFNTDIFKKENISLLVTIGGDDTASTANRIAKFLELHEIKISNIHVPKTIDNDLPLAEGIPTFGFMTAKEKGVEIGKVVKSEAITSGNWYLMMLMGREAGHLALEVGRSIQADMIIIPEMFQKTQITIEKIIKLVISSIVKKKILKMYHGVCVLSEGIFHFLKKEDIEHYGIIFNYDDHGHPELNEISKAHIINGLLTKCTKDLNLGVKSRPVEVGYSLRCADPCAGDLSYCMDLGKGIKTLFDAGHSGCMVSMDLEGGIIPIYLKDVEDSKGKICTRLVNMENEMIKTTFTGSMFYLNENDIKAASKYLDNPEDYSYDNIMGNK